MSVTLTQSCTLSQPLDEQFLCQKLVKIRQMDHSNNRHKLGGRGVDEMSLSYASEKRQKSVTYFLNGPKVQ
jgi:hypothetical protein